MVWEERGWCPVGSFVGVERLDGCKDGGGVDGQQSGGGLSGK